MTGASKHPYLLLLAAIVLALVVLAIERPERSRVDEASDATFSPGFDSDEVQRIEVSQLLYGAELKRDGEEWLVREITTPLREQIAISRDPEREGPWHRADRTRVSSSLGSFGGLGAGIVVSTSEAKRGLYQVDAGGLRVKLFGKDDNVIEDVVIGKNGPDLGSTYLRRFASDEVRLVRRPLTGVFTPLAENWREKRLWSLLPEDIAGISVVSDDGAYAAKKEGEAWKSLSAASPELDQEAMRGLIPELADMRAEGFPESSAPEPGEQVLTLTLERRKGAALKLTIFEKDAAGMYPARLEGVDDTYLLSSRTAETIPTRLPIKPADASRSE